MERSTPTLTQSGSLAVLLRRDSDKTIWRARRRARFSDFTALFTLRRLTATRYELSNPSERFAH